MSMTRKSYMTHQKGSESAFCNGYHNNYVLEHLERKKHMVFNGE
jgi:hypothetical protein